MEVKPAEDMGFSISKFLKYSVTSIVLIGLVLVPSFVTNTYVRVLNTVLLIALMGLIGRTYFSAIFSFKDIEPPELEGELPSVSVVIPAYNEAQVLEDTIEACAEVDYPEDKYEVVLCYEAASTDGTEEIAEKAAKEHDFLKAVRRDEPGGGKAKATNYALEYAENDIIASIDADHCFKPNAIKRAVRWFDDEDLWCIKGRCFGYNPADSLLSLHATVERHIAEKIDIYARQIFGGFTFFGGGQAFFRSEVFDEIGSFDEDILVEDIDMSTKIHHEGKKIIVDPQVITYEENPATLQAWWSQRKRWARGWMQVAVKHTKGLTGDSDLSLTKRIDGGYTLLYAVVPTFLILLMPMMAISRMGVNTATYIPNSGLLWVLAGVAPFTLSYVVFFQDFMDGEKHHFLEYFAAITLWAYFFFQALVHLTAFIEEFIFDKKSVYVTTSRAED